MAEIKSTRLRYIRAATPEELVGAIDALPFRVEIKGGPIFAESRWTLFFVIPEVEGINFNSIDLGG